MKECAKRYHKTEDKNVLEILKNGKIHSKFARSMLPKVQQIAWTKRCSILNKPNTESWGTS